MPKYVLYFAGIAAVAVFYGAIQVYKIWLKRLYELCFGNVPKNREWTLRVFGIVLGACAMYIFSIVSMFLLFFFGFFVVLELVRLLFRKRLTEAIDKRRVVRVIWNSGLIPIVLSLLIVGYGYVNIRNVTRTEYTVETDKQLTREYKLLVLSDTHYGTIFKKNKLDKLVDSLVKEEFDAVLLVGDIVDERTTNEEMQEVFRAFGRIQSTYGTYFVYGNHDIQQYSRNPAYTAEELESAMEASGITILADKVITLNDDLLLVGHKDYNASRREVAEILKETDTSRYTILMDHQPMEYPRAAAAGVDLMVSGHTHGGQFFPLGIAMDLLKTSDQCYGKKSVGNMIAIVTSGVAGWGFPIRTERHSEYVIVRIKGK